MSVRDKGLTRGSFLRLFAAAPLAGAAVAPSVAAFAQGVSAGVTLNFHFSGDSYRVNYTDPTNNIDPQTGKPYPDRLVMGGSGEIFGNFKVGQIVSDGQVSAQGSFAHYEKNLPPGNNIPLQFTGTWIATRLVSFELLGFLGTDSEGNFPLAAGVLELDINLVRPKTTAIPLTMVPSVLTLVSNLQPEPGVSKPAGVKPSKLPDGVTLLAPNDPVNGFYFIPIPVESDIPRRTEKKRGDEGWGDERANHAREAHTPVLFSTLNELRTDVT
jgi:hypothetical protein